MNKFSEIINNPSLLDTLSKNRISKPTPVQEKAIPEIFKNKNLVVIAKTGSGKTLAYMLPILSKIDTSKGLQSVIFCPTRELVHQIYDLSKEYCKSIGVTISPIIGGKQKKISEKYRSNIVVGTPYSIKKAYEDKTLNVTETETFVLDEADMLYDLGFFEDISDIILKSKPTSQILFFSATINDQISQEFKKISPNTSIIKIDDIWVNNNIKHMLVVTKPNQDRYLTLKSIIKSINPYLCIIFVNSKKMLKDLYQRMLDDNYKVVALHGDVERNDRRNIINDIYKSKYQYIIASDLVSRGIDIKNVSDIISVDLPQQIEWYIHRAGRTGRNNENGNSYLIYDIKEKKEISFLKSKGIEWKIASFDKLDNLNEVKTKIKKPNSRFIDKNVRKEIAKIKSKKTKKVKPGYKKKIKAEIEQAIKKNKKKIIEKDFKKQLMKKWKKNSALKKR
jgi:ATP-dependent RNA helicase CshB